ncbi:MAG: hypothetical protein CL683_04930 [Brevundimonas sp.]|nr:hypothetical protein [Brevundimonas sp.]HAJ02105.1 hypothetical protein [Brevundimonas sp.]
MAVDPDNREWLEGARLISIGVVAAVVSAGLVIGFGRAVITDEADRPVARAEILISASTR